MEFHAFLATVTGKYIKDYKFSLEVMNFCLANHHCFQTLSIFWANTDKCGVFADSFTKEVQLNFFIVRFCIFQELIQCDRPSETKDCTSLHTTCVFGSGQHKKLESQFFCFFSCFVRFLLVKRGFPFNVSRWLMTSLLIESVLLIRKISVTKSRW